MTSSEIAEAADKVITELRRELAGARQALLALTAGYQRDHLPTAIWKEVDAAMSVGGGSAPGASKLHPIAETIAAARAAREKEPHTCAADLERKLSTIRIQGAGGKQCVDVQGWDKEHERWIEDPGLPCPVCNHCGTVVQENCLTCGGSGHAGDESKEGAA